MTVCALAARLQGPVVRPVRTDFALVSNGPKFVAPKFIVPSRAAPCPDGTDYWDAC
jgi:hypothetical protein